ncbi:MAG: hypothetical protein JNJ47_01740 [Alphaproteobacteria bacterium]|nr:hypothetical protein [Alphaproteobacteria bacterium]
MMSHILPYNRQIHRAGLEGPQFTEELLPYHPFNDEQGAGSHKELVTLTESNPEDSPTAPIQCHMDNPSSSYLPRERGKPRESRVSLIRMEFVELTNDPLIAAILNQLVYWSQRVSDFDLFWREEASSSPDGASPQYGWFYKSTSELLEETMVRVTPVTMRRYLSFLTEQGWIETRVNPRYKWNRTPQYRVNLRKLYTDLQALGFNLPGFPHDNIFPLLQKEKGEKNVSSSDQNLSFDENKTLLSKETKFYPREEKNDSSKDQNENKDLSLQETKFSSRIEKNVLSHDQNLPFEKNKTLPSRETNFYSREEKNDRSNTEIITENINREHTQRKRAREDKNFCDKNFSAASFAESDFSGEVLRIWNARVGQGELPPVQLTDERRRKVHALFPLYFESDLNQWKLFCERVCRSPFLMGQGSRKWRVSLDWILVEENLVKVLEGNFDDGMLLDQKIEKAFEDANTKEARTVLESIADPMWRGWCSQLNFSPQSRDYVSLLDLKTIANAKFLEIEDNHLVWVGSFDARALSKIEDLRLKILPIVQRTFPHARTVRTRLNENDFSLPPVTPDPSQISALSTHNQGENHYA